MAALLPFEARLAGDVQLDPMAHQLTYYLRSHQTKHSFDGGMPKLLHPAALGADDVMVVVGVVRAITWRTVRQAGLAEHTRFQEQLHGPVDRGPAYRGKLRAHLL